jgi:hypothetical protein
MNFWKGNMCRVMHLVSRHSLACTSAKEDTSLTTVRPLTVLTSNLLAVFVVDNADSPYLVCSSSSGSSGTTSTKLLNVNDYKGRHHLLQVTYSCIIHSLPRFMHCCSAPFWAFVFLSLDQISSSTALHVFSQWIQIYSGTAMWQLQCYIHAYFSIHAVLFLCIL